MTELELIFDEIPYGGKGYIRLKRYDAADFSEVMAAKLSELRDAGADKLYFGARDEAFLSRESFACAGHTFRYYSDFDWLHKELKDGAGPALRMKRMDAGNAPLFAALYNEAFAEVPNAATVDDIALGRMLGGPLEAGFFMLGGEPLGVYELDCSESPPEIVALAIRPERQGRGYGAQALCSLERHLFLRGYEEARLLVASANDKAYGLYEACGYRRAERQSRWFTVDSEDA